MCTYAYLPNVMLHLLRPCRWKWDMFGKKRDVLLESGRKRRERGLILRPLSICTYARRYNTVGSDQKVTGKDQIFFFWQSFFYEKRNIDGCGILICLLIYLAKSFNQFPASFFKKQTIPKQYALFGVSFLFGQASFRAFFLLDTQVCGRSSICGTLQYSCCFPRQC